jgi:hypothetical protein
VRRAGLSGTEVIGRHVQQLEVPVRLPNGPHPKKLLSSSISDAIKLDVTGSNAAVCGGSRAIVPFSL